MINYHVAPQNQGQAVEVAYAAVYGVVIRRIHDRSIGSSPKAYEYAISKMRVDDEGDYWQSVPRNKRWRQISAEEAIRIIETA